MAAEVDLGTRAVVADVELVGLATWHEERRLGIADVDEHPVAVVINEIDVATDPPARLVVHLDHTGENRAALEHLA